MSTPPLNKTRDIESFRRLFSELEPHDQITLLHFFPRFIFSHEEHRALCAELVRNIDYLDEEQRMWLSEAIEAGFKPRAGRPKNPRYTTIMSWLLWNHFYGSQKLPRTEIISALMQSFEIEAVAAQQALNRAKREFDKTINSARRRLTPPGKGSSE